MGNCFGTDSNESVKAALVDEPTLTHTPAQLPPSPARPAEAGPSPADAPVREPAPKADDEPQEPDPGPEAPPSPPDTPQPVEFAFDAPEGTAVAVAGSFNGWEPQPLPASGRLALSLAPGRYTYKFVVGGEWVADPNAAEAESDGHGGENSVVEV